MILIAIPLALFVIFAGTQLLLQVKREAPVRFFRFIAWFLIIMGFLVGAASTGAVLIRTCCGGITGHSYTMGYHERPCCGSAHGCGLHHGADGWKKHSKPGMHQAHRHRHPCCETNEEDAGED